MMSLAEQEKQIKLLTWAFDKGYHQGKNDGMEGVFIAPCELAKHFLDEAAAQFPSINSKETNKNLLKLVKS